MLLAAAILFITAALGGAVLLTFVLRGISPPKGLAIGHGLLAGIGLILLLIYIVTVSPRPFVSLILFLIAAAGGLLMAFRDFTAQRIPPALAVFHGVVAIAAIVVLFVVAW